MSICYCSQDQLRRQCSTFLVYTKVSTHRSVPLYTPCAAFAPHSDWWCAIGGQGLGAIHFRSRSLRQVGCYTFHSGFQPSWPPTNSTEQTTAFRGSVDERTAFRAPHTHFWFSPHRQYCLPVVAHLGPRRVFIVVVPQDARSSLCRILCTPAGVALIPSAMKVHRGLHRKAIQRMPTHATPTSCEEPVVCHTRQHPSSLHLLIVSFAH